MDKLRTLLCASFIVAIALSPVAWARTGEVPTSFIQGMKSLNQVERRVLESEKVQNALDEEARRAIPSARNPGPFRFAVPVETYFTTVNSGTWQDVPGGGRLWRLVIDSSGAENLNLAFTRFDLAERAKLWIYDPAGDRVEGPYTSADRSDEGRFFTPIIQGEEIVIELFIPEGAYDAGEETPDGGITIGRVNHGFRGLGGPDKAGGDKQGTCNIDTVCPAGNAWHDQIRSVARYTIDGTGSCSGQLLTNTDNDFTPYFLSAFHCGVSVDNDDTLVFYWNFESPNCGDLSGGSLTDNQSGSTFRAGWADSDFLLVELGADPDPASNVYFSGWNATGATPGSAVAIHHPSGDEKAISFENEGLSSTAYFSDTADASANHWRVSDWNVGTTEPGSSGSCLWNPDDELCVGQLHGGEAACSNDDPDWYGKLSVSWEGGGSSATRLRDWLNPANDGMLTNLGDEPSDPGGPSLRIVETVLDYGEVELGFAFTKAVVIFNDGDAPLTVSLENVSPADPDLGQWSEINEATNDVVPVGGDPLVLRQVYEPQALGTHTFQMEVTSDDPGAASIIVTLTGEAGQPTPIDSELVLDRSGSMDERAGDRSKIDAMQSAADLYAHLLRDGVGDRLGFVKYNNANSVYLDLLQVSAPHIGTAEDLLSNPSLNDPARLLPQGATGIGGAMQTAAGEFGAPDPDRLRVMVVLTDGIENRDPRIADVLGGIQGSDPDLQMYSVGLGANIEPAKLQSITNVSNGYHQVSEDLSGVDIFDLEIFYFKIFATASGMELVVDPTHPVNISGPDAVVVDSAQIVSSDKSAVFLILDDPLLRPFYEIQFLDPSGNVLVPGSSVGGVPIQEFSRLNYRVFRIVFPSLAEDYVGVWTVLLKPNKRWDPKIVRSILADGPIDYSGYLHPIDGFAPIGFAAAVASNYKLDARATPTGFLPGAEVRLTAALSDRGWPSVDGSVAVTARDPVGGIKHLKLYDDGSHGDGEAGDGTWTNRFVETGLSGVYEFLFQAKGVNERGELAPREATRYVSLIAPSDPGLEKTCEERGREVTTSAGRQVPSKVVRRGQSTRTTNR